jgi:large subunit ribosomal protein L15
MAKELNLSSLKPAQSAKARKRVGRGLGSGKGRYSGRGIKGQKARSGSHKMRAGFEGGQMPLYMRVGKQRGSTSKDAMPIGPFRTSTAPVNVGSLDAFDDGAEVTPEALVEKGLIRNTKIDVKLLGNGELAKKLTIRVHAISATARDKVEKAGGTVSLLKEPAAKRPVRAKRGPVEGARGNRKVPPQDDGGEAQPEPEQAEETAPEES